MNKHLDIVWTNQFKKDYKLAMKRHLDIELLDDIIRKLASGDQLPEKNKDHALTGNWVGHRECHIQPDWLLVYRIENDLLVLTYIPFCVAEISAPAVSCPAPAGTAFATLSLADAKIQIQSYSLFFSSLQNPFRNSGIMVCAY